LRQEVNTDEVEGSEDSDSDEEGQNDEDLGDEDDSQVVVDNVRTSSSSATSALAWADKFILETRRKGGRQTENTVLKQWKVCQKAVSIFFE
jgi:hypothetical protein